MCCIESGLWNRDGKSANMTSTLRASAIVLASALLTAGSIAFGAPEPWADSKLPVKTDLEVWLDISRQNTARQLRLLPVLSEGRPVDIWLDASGNKVDLTQPQPDARPHVRTSPAGASARFDGTNDFLFAANLRRELTNATIFVVAAPRSNAGFFRAFLGLNQSGRNDYTSGLNLDQGPGGSTRFTVINAEGVGFGGVQNLLTNPAAFRTFQIIALTCATAEEGVHLFVDGKSQASRNKDPGTLHMDQLTVGARCYSNAAEPPHAQGFFDGDIAEVIIYRRALADAERSAVEQYLAAKHASLRSQPIEGNATHSFALEPVANPPAVQMFLPGFTVREVPLSLKNINNLKYRPDGKLVALGYNGRIYLLSDSDGDGLEDKADLFWDRDTLRAPIGMALTPAGYSRGEGVFVTAKGKVALIVDRDHDGRADEEVVVASGWKELGHGVDALGVALDKEGNIFFGLGCANFTDAYLIDKATGRSQYRLASERGTIMKVPPDFSKREIVCTGIRFPVALAFNPEGDLFCTDQEGATWLPNGNPFDELLHIQRGRHYGFPPRHPKHLPNVIDEPSVYDYAPQHQSTCGLNFNEPVNGGPIFGPAWWKGDAIVSGYSRAKLYRTALAKTSAGYVAQNQVIGCLNMLTVDASISPRGALVVATHSGNPDWGSGPDGKGKLYHVAYTGTDIAQPIATWAASPTEFRIAFDRPLDPIQLKDVMKRSAVTRGRHVSSGDRFESLRPGYQAVQDQLVTSREEVRILSANVTSDNRTVIFRTTPQTVALNYALALPKLAPTQKAKNEIPQHETIDLVTDLTGIEASWRGDSDEWNGWLPHVDLKLAQQFTQRSADHERLWKLLGFKGTLTLRGQLDLARMLQPAVQPGSTLDFTPAPEDVIVELAAVTPFTVRPGDRTIEAVSTGKNGFKAVVVAKREAIDKWLPFEIAAPTGKGDPNLEISWHTTEDSRGRAFPLRRILLPWATPTGNAPSSSDRIVPELAGGNWLHGKRIYFSDQVACYKCHRVRGEGGKLGPDLSNLVFRDYASVLRDIASPSATINPEHLAYNVELKSGDGLAGVLLSDVTNEVVLGVVSGESVHVAKKQLSSMKPSALSLMPEGLLQTLNSQQLKDLMTFLLVSPLEPATLEITGEPPARRRGEIAAAITNAATAQNEAKPLHILLAAGPKDHGPSEHDYPLWQKRWEKLLGLADGIKISTAFGWPNAEQFQKADVIVFYSNNPGWSGKRGEELDRFLNRGGGLVYIHYAVDGHTNVTELSERIGLAWRGGASKFRHGPLDMQLHEHPLSKGIDRLKLVDESYWQLKGDKKRVQLLATGVEDGAPQPLMWTREQGKGRVFVSIPGHYTWTFDDPLFRLLLLRGICWSGHQPINRLAELATIGARLAD